MLRPLRTYQVVVDVVAASVFAAAVWWPESATGRSTAYNALGTILVVVLMAAALAFRRLSPAGALALAWSVGIVQMALGRSPSVTDLAIFAVLYAAAAYGSRAVFWLGFASAVLGAAVTAVYLFVLPLRPDGQPSTVAAAVSQFFAVVLALLLAWTVGALVRTALRAQENRVAQQRAEAEAIAEQERVRLARDMHDVVAHSLAVVVAQADGARYASSSDPDIATRALDTISTTAREALFDVRLLLSQLRHRESVGPQPMLADLDQLYEQLRAAGVDLRVEVARATAGAPPASIQLAVYRILQEALTNAMQHGGAGPVVVRLAWRVGEVHLEVRNALDGGSALSPPELQHGSGGPGTPGHGVIGMRERALLVGGRLEALARDGDFVVRATLPTGAGT